ncbi:MAG TPA: alkaline phosphatase D family protein, partial [Burkholderiaceae bacterium]|nr:alkaline phosphatase D family protein [Burkholderiaceae bacterium]
MRAIELRVAALAMACGLAPTASCAQVAQGPLVQAVTASQAGVWLRTTIAQPVRVRVSAPDGTQTYTSSRTTSPISDYTAHFIVTGLLPASTYRYQVGTTDGEGVEHWTGTYAFDTVATEPARLDIAVLSDFANKLVGSPSLRTALQARPDLLAVIGDLDHRGPAGASHPTLVDDPAAEFADMRAMHRDTRDPATPLGADFASGLIGAPDSGVPQIPWVYAWDDHDFCANNAGMKCPAAALAFQALDEYYILAPDNWQANGCSYPADFESLTYGTLAQLFFLDARSNRVPFSPTRAGTNLGACQLQWLEARLHASKALWKIV